MVTQDGIAGSAAVARWTERLEELHRRIGHRFARSEARERVSRYLVGLLGKVERKNGWQLAEAIGERDPQGVQRLLNSAKWDADAVREDLREYVVEHLADKETGILIVDETGFLKKGEKSVGVSPQYTGTAGDTVNCQVGVFLAYSSNKGAAFVDRALYLPKGWTSNPVRRAEAGIPEEITFHNKIELAEVMLERVSFPRQDGHSKVGTVSPQKGGPSARTNTALPAGVQTRIRQALPLRREVDPEDGRGVGYSQRIPEEVDQAARNRRRRTRGTHHRGT